MRISDWSSDVCSSDLPRSAPIVGGLVLSLMTLPIIIIAGRAALKAVPPSIREAALAVGESRMQTVTHHVLPLALPARKRVVQGKIVSARVDRGGVRIHTTHTPHKYTLHQRYPQ